MYIYIQQYSWNVCRTPCHLKTPEKLKYLILVRKCEKSWHPDMLQQLLYLPSCSHWTQFLSFLVGLAWNTPLGKGVLCKGEGWMKKIHEESVEETHGLVQILPAVKCFYMLVSIPCKKSTWQFQVHVWLLVLLPFLFGFV